MSNNTAQETVVCGINPVTELLQHKPDAVIEVMLDSAKRNKRLGALLQIAQDANVTINESNKSDLDRLTAYARHQGVAARAVYREHDADNLASLLKGLDHAPLLLILDGVTDPHNFGASLRAADGAGVDAVIVPKDNASPVTPVVHASSAGASQIIPVYRVANLARTMDELRQAGIWIIGASDDASLDIYSDDAIDYTGSIAIVLGSEGEGLRRLTRENCDQLLSIPMFGTVSSLNVSVSAGVFLFEVRRQRLQAE
ncbi:MAG: 23S rRNA (guanosine(2251)-2'-O)-methyltransferase RlmB [Gammaproteobacteria bacterium]|nr:23S rRNA (guanosine(2251)-2'-O)-methyltransferase RlmB [Gammaproteobacteria bacterium]